MAIRMFEEFSHRHTPCVVDGVDDVVILSRDSKSTSVTSKEFQFIARFSSKSLASIGSMLEAGTDKLLIQTLRITPDTDKYCSAIKTNVTIEVQRYKQDYDDSDNELGGPTFESVVAGINGFAQYASAQLRQKEPGLLPSTSYILLLQVTVDVRKPNDVTLESPDRVVMGGRSYQVDSVDAIKFPNLLHIQLSEDIR